MTVAAALYCCHALMRVSQTVPIGRWPEIYLFSNQLFELPLGCISVFEVTHSLIFRVQNKHKLVCNDCSLERSIKSSKPYVKFATRDCSAISISQTPQKKKREFALMLVPSLSFFADMPREGLWQKINLIYLCYTEIIKNLI